LPFLTAAREVVVRKFQSTRYRWFDDAGQDESVCIGPDFEDLQKVAAHCIPSTPWIVLFCRVVLSCLAHG
jgi:hypothetical protein